MKEILIQSHDWGNDVGVKDYSLPCDSVRIKAVYENMVTAYCGGEEHAAVGQIVSSPQDLLNLIGRPGGYQHCRIQVVVEQVFISQHEENRYNWLLTV